MYYDIPEGLGLRKEANAWARLFQQAIKRFPRMSLRNATALTNQRYAHKTMRALNDLHQSRVNRAVKNYNDTVTSVANSGDLVSNLGRINKADMGVLRAKGRKTTTPGFEWGFARKAEPGLGPYPKHAPGYGTMTHLGAGTTQDLWDFLERTSKQPRYQVKRPLFGKPYKLFDGYQGTPNRLLRNGRTYSGYPDYNNPRYVSPFKHTPVDVIPEYLPSQIK